MAPETTAAGFAVAMAALIAARNRRELASGRITPAEAHADAVAALDLIDQVILPGRSAAADTSLDLARAHLVAEIGRHPPPPTPPRPPDTPPTIVPLRRPRR